MDPILEIFAAPESAPRVRHGEVTATSPLTIRFNGTAPADAVPGVRRLKSYAPIVGDTVVIIKVGPLFLALGAMTT